MVVIGERRGEDRIGFVMLVGREQLFWTWERSW